MIQKIQRYADKWDLVLEKEIQTLSGTVWLAKQGGLPVALKLFHPNTDEMRQKDMLQHFGGKGAVRVIAADGPALLLERLTPGRHVLELTKDGRDDDATRIFCRVARQLHAAQGPLESFKPIVELASAFDNYSASGNTRISAQQVREARDLFLSLTASQGPPVLLHGDLHHDNILDGGVRGWAAIDPKGYVGEPLYEAGAWLRNPNVQYGAGRDIIERRIAIMTEELGWDRERLLHWAYAQIILSAIWCIEDKQSPAAALVFATVLRETIAASM